MIRRASLQGLPATPLPAYLAQQDSGLALRTAFGPPPAGKEEKRASARSAASANGGGGDDDSAAAPAHAPAAPPAPAAPAAPPAAMASPNDRSAAAAFRASVRSGEWTGQTSGAAQGFVQANFVALPHKAAGDFLHFALRNPRACPVLAVTRPGEASLPAGLAAGADLRTDIPKYRVWRDGALVDEVTDISELWTDDMVGFLLGCSYSWEHALAEAGLCPRQIEEQCNVPMFRTGIRNTAVGPFAGDLVVSMRPYPAGSVPAVAGLTGRYPGAHGGPIHWGDPADLGLTWEALRDPHWGDAVSLKEDDVPMFWACGVTPQTAVEEAKLPLVITHAPGHMFICDLLNAELDVSP